MQNLELKDGRNSLLFDINMICCKKWRPKLHDKLSKTKWTGRYHYFESEHESQAYNLVDISAEKLYYELDDPLGSMAAHMETCLGKLQGISLVLGFGLGYSTLMLLNQRNFVSRSIIVLEPDLEILLAAFRTVDCRQIIESQDVLMLAGFELNELASAIQTHLSVENRLVNAKNVQIIDQPASMEVHETFYLSAVKKVREAIFESVKFIGNCPNDALQGLDNMLSNIRRQSSLPGIESLKGLFKGKPGIVVASGPSLDKNVHLLDQVGDRAVICSADASLRHLLRRNLKPHLISCVERLDETAKLFVDLEPNDCQNVFMVTSPVVHRATFEAFKGPIIATEREYGYISIIENNKGHLVPGPSAGNMAFRVLNYLGCDPIILVGQDLALSPEGKSHAEGDPYGDRQEVYTTNSFEIEGNYEKTLETNPILKMFHAAYELDVASFHGTVINSTEGGAKIIGTKLLPLQQALKDYVLTKDEAISTSQSIVERISQALKYPSEKEAHTAVEHARARIREALSSLQKAKVTISEARKAVEVFKNNLDGPGQASIQGSQREEVLESMNAISALTQDQKFKSVAMDALSAVFFHTMTSYISSLSNAENETEQDEELARNVSNLANNFEVLIKYIESIYQGHLNDLDTCSHAQAESYFERSQELAEPFEGTLVNS